MKVFDDTMLEGESSTLRYSYSSPNKDFSSNSISSRQTNGIPSKDMKEILKTLKNSFGEYRQNYLDLNVQIEDFVRLRNGNHILGMNRDGYVTAIDISCQEVQNNHYLHTFTGIVANSPETQAFLSTQVGKIVVFDISDIFNISIINEVQCFSHPVDALRILSSDLLIAYDFTGKIEHLKLEDSQIVRIDTIEYQTVHNASSMVSPNGEYLLCYGNQSMLVIDRKGNKVYETEVEILHCCLSDKLFAYMTESLKQDEIHVVSLTDPENLFFAISPHMDSKIDKLYLSEDSQYLMGVAYYNSSKIWDLLNQKIEDPINLGTPEVIQLKFGKSRAIHYNTTSSFHILSYTDLCAHKLIDLDGPELCTENLYNKSIVTSSQNALREIDLRTGRTKECILEQWADVKVLKHFGEEKYCIGISDKSSFHAIRIQDLDRINAEDEFTILLDSEAVCIEMDKNKDRIFLGCSDRTIVTIYTSNWEKEQMTTKETPICLLFIEEYGLICGFENGNIQIVDQEESFKCHSSSIASLAYSSKGMLVSCSKNGRIGIWNLEDLRFPITFIESPARTIQVSKSGHYLYSINTKGIFKCWCLETFNCLFTEDYKGYHSFFITDSEEHMALMGQTNLKIVDGPLNENLRVAGTAKKNDFIDYIRKICTRGKVPDFEEEMENGVILPLMIMPIHLHVALNLVDHLEQSLSKGTPVFNPINGLNPLKLAAETENGDCFKVLIKGLKRNQNPHALGFMNASTLVTLNRSTLPSLPKLYDLLFQKSSNTSLKVLGDSSSKLPEYNLSSSKRIDKNEFIFKNSNKPKKVVYWESQFKFNFETGSSESKEFLRSLVRSKNSEFLTSSFIDNYLNFKWNQVWWVLLAHFIVYLAFLATVVATLYIDLEKIEGLWICISVLLPLSILISISEIVQMVGAFKAYVMNIWNWLEIARAVTVIVYVVSYFEDFDRSIFGIFSSDDIHLALAVWPFVQGFSYFRIFSYTRYMVYLIVQVFKDLVVYMVLLFYTVFCISCVLYVILDLGVKAPVMDYFLVSGALSFANFDVKTFYGRISVAVFSILLNTLVMLNLAIAIIGDTYDKVQDNKEVANNKELAQLILEVESMMLWKKSKNSLKYFHMCGWDDSNSSKTEWLGRIKELKLILKKQDKSIKETKKGFELFKNENDQRLEIFKRETDQKLDLILSKLN